MDSVLAANFRTNNKSRCNRCQLHATPETFKVCDAYDGGKYFRLVALQHTHQTQSKKIDLAHIPGSSLSSLPEELRAMIFEPS